MSGRPTPLGPGDALILVDVQNDFLPGGALAVPGGDAVVPVLREYVRAAVAAGAHVVATRDWHPRGHCSFRERGGPWPAHCVQGTGGAELAADLRLPAAALVVSKGADAERDAYSGFDDTKLDAELRARGVERVLVGGLATDYCVLRTVRDARAAGYAVLLLDDAVRGMNAERTAAAREEMIALGAIPVTLEAISLPEVTGGRSA